MGRLILASVMLVGVARADVCGPGVTEVVVDTKRHALTLCDAGRAAGEYAVSIGRAGTGKSRDGDNKTPLGRYRLGAPRASSTYGIFIPVAYPTPAQAAAGATGGDIGLHGPRRDKKWLGRLARLADWTRGCIALATDDEITAVAAWVHAHPTAPVHLI